MTNATKTTIDNEIISRMHYVINCENRKIQDSVREMHYNYLNGFLSALHQSESISLDEYRHYSNMVWDMYGDRQTEAENNLTSMDVYGRVAVLTDGESIYSYYNTDDGEILRVSDENEADRNPSWDIDLLSEDLMKEDTDIIFLCDDMIDFIKNDPTAGDLYDDNYSYVLNKVKEYQDHE